jgi:hypothetical protein
VTVDPNRNLSDGLLPSGMALSFAEARAGTQSDALPGMDPTQLRCEALDARVRAIDERASEAQARQNTTRLAALRRDDREEQYRMHC